MKRIKWERSWEATPFKRSGYNLILRAPRSRKTGEKAVNGSCENGTLCEPAWCKRQWMGHVRMVASVSLLAVRGSKWIMWVWYREAALSQSFPRELCLSLLIELTNCSIIDNVQVSIIDNMQVLVVSKSTSGLMFHCQLTFILKVSHTHADMYKPYWINSGYLEGELTWWNDYDDDDDDDETFFKFLRFVQTKQLIIAAETDGSVKKCC